MYLKNLKYCTAITALMFLPSFAMAGSGTVNYQMSFLSKFGTAGGGDGQFGQPEQIAFGSDGRLYVADRYNNRIQIFDANGNYINKLYPNNVYQPIGIKNDGNGNLIISGGTSYNISIIDQITLAQEAQFGGYGSGNGMFTDTAGIAIQSNSRILAVDGGNNRINVFDSSGNYITQFGTTGSGSGQLLGPHDIGIASNGNIYITDRGNNRIQIFDSSYNYIGSLGNGQGTNLGEFDSPYTVTFDSLGNIYITENYRIQVFKSDGTPLFAYGSNGTGDGQFNLIRGFAIGPDGRLYASEFLNNRIQILSLTSTETFSASPTGGNETAATPDASLELTGTGSFTNNFIGYDRLVVNGTDWTLGGSSTFDQSVILNAGLLTVNGSLTAPTISILSGTILGGTGTLVGAVSNDGAITPGNNAIGTLSVTGSYTNTATSIYQVDADAAGNSDLINVTGTATLNGGIVDVIAANGNYAANTNYTILSASGGYTGTFGTVTSNLAFLTPTLDYIGNNVVLKLNNTNTPTPGGGLDFNPYASSSSEKAAAAALDSYTASGMNGDTQALNAVTAFNTQEAAQFLKQSTPNETTSMPQVQTSIVAQMVQPVQQRMASLNLNSSSGISSGDELTERNMWIEALGGFANQDTKGNNNGYRTGITGIRGGIDKAFSANSTIGLSVAHAVGTTSFDQGTDRAQSKYTHIDVYAQRTTRDFIIEGVFGIGGGAIETTRFINAGSLSRVANGSTQAYDATAIAKISKPIAMQYNYTLIPSMTAQASWQRQNSFSETGAGGLNLSFNDTTTKPVTLNPMLHIQKVFVNKERNYKFTPIVGVGPSWQVTDRESTSVAGFSGAAQQFRVTGLKQDALALNIQAGVTFEPFGTARYVPSLSINAHSKLSNTASAHSANLNLNWKW